MTTISPQAPPARPSTATAMVWLVVAGVLLASFNLRTAVTSVGPLLAEVQNGLGMSAAVAGILTTLPVICFAVMGGATPVLARRFGERRLLLAALGLMVLGLLVRSMASDVSVFLIASTAALAGGAVGNVAIPAVVKRHFPHRIGAMTTAYSTALAIGAMAAAAATVPAATAFDGWQWALGMWAAPAALAMIPWLFLRAGHQDIPDRVDPIKPVKGLARSGLAWAMLLAFGSQSLIAYVMFGWLPEMMREHGYSSAQAGVMLAVFTAVSIPISLVVPILAARMPSQRAILVVLVSGYLFGMPLLWLGGESAITWIGLLLVAVGMGTFPLMLTMFGLRSRTSAGTAGLSAFSQSGGYLMSGLGPVLVGVLYESTGSWTGPFVLLLIAAVTHLVTSWQVARPRFLEDELAEPQKASSSR